MIEACISVRNDEGDGFELYKKWSFDYEVMPREGDTLVLEDISVKVARVVHHLVVRRHPLEIQCDEILDPYPVTSGLDW